MSTNLPLDVWFAIIEHLSLAELVSIYDAFGSTASNALSITKRHATNVISTMLAIGAVRINLSVPVTALVTSSPPKIHVSHNTTTGKIMDNALAPAELTIHGFVLPWNTPELFNQTRPTIPKPE